MYAQMGSSIHGSNPSKENNRDDSSLESTPINSIARQIQQGTYPDKGASASASVMNTVHN
jgi:hypothetical protein